jgi:hypothetical protein
MTSTRPNAQVNHYPNGPILHRDMAPFYSAIDKVFRQDLIKRRINQFFMHFEWRLSLATVIWSLVVPAGIFALPAWATKVAGVFSQYAPLS